MLINKVSQIQDDAITCDEELVISGITRDKYICVYGDIPNLVIDDCHGKMTIFVYGDSKSVIVNNCTFDVLIIDNEIVVQNVNIMNSNFVELTVNSFEKILVDNRSNIHEANLSGSMFMFIEKSCEFERVNKWQIRKI